jgi:hypothetical protein
MMGALGRLLLVRRLTSKIGVSIVKARAAMYFGPQDDPYIPVQLGVGVRGVAEIVVHPSVRWLKLAVVTLRLR